MWGEDNWREALGLNDVLDNNNDGDHTESSEDQVSPPQSIIEFVGSFVHVGEDHATEAAFNVIRPYIENDKTEDKTVAEETSNGLGRATLKAAVKILSERVPSANCKAPTTEKAMQKELAKWLQNSNAKREFMFHSTNNLKDLVAKRGIKMSGSKTIDKIIEALANESLGLSSSGQDADNNAYVVEGSANLAIKAILQKSFLPHQKGATREACSMGHILEQPVLEKWIATTSMRRYPVQALKVNGAYTAGLVAKQDSPWAKDSIDFILTVSHHDLEDHQTWGAEVKARVSNKTAAREEDFLSNNRNVNEKYSGKRHS